LRKLGESAEFWIGTLDTNGVKQTMKTLDILNRFIMVLKITKEEEVPVVETGDDDEHDSIVDN
jgi:hypothetical protein